jgi:hypothetical protein
MKQYIYIGVFMFSISPILVAQNEDDALRFSQYDIIGSGRYTGMSGAFTALGGDFSAIHQNPAAVGVFRKSDVSYSFYVGNMGIQANHYGQESAENKTVLKTANFGFVVTHSFKEGSSWRNGGFSFSRTKLADFNSDLSIYGQNTESSLLDVYQNDIQNGNFNSFGSDLAWQTYLVDTLPGSPDSFFTQIPVRTQTQTNQVATTGFIRETSLSYGVNYDDKLYLGASLGFLTLDYSRRDYFSETMPDDDTTTVLNSYFIQNTLNSTGSGARVGFGFIYRPVDFIRIGASAYSRGFMSINDTWNSEIEANYDQVGTLTHPSPNGLFEYNLSTPARYNAGLAFIINKIGLVSFDYEHVDYASMKLSPEDDYAFTTENEAIKTYLQSTQVVRSGVELRFEDWRVRLGAKYTGNTYSSTAGNANSSLSYSGGLGYKGEHFYADWGLSVRTGRQNYYVYDPAYISATKLSYYHVISSFTVGVRF